MSAEDHRYAVIVAGGSGTRLWPLSRQALPKQMQALMGDKSLIRETFDRVTGVVPLQNIMVSTTRNYAGRILDLLPDLPTGNMIVEPEARGTAAAFALFTHHIREVDPEAVIFSLASDHAITEIDKFQETMRRSFEFIEANRQYLAFVGIEPVRPDSGLGYIKVRERIDADTAVFAAEKFVEKPSPEVAKAYVESGEYYWNAGYYCYAAQTLLDAYDDADPRLVDAARAYAVSRDAADFAGAPEKVHEIEVIDSSRHPLAVIPADFEWSDIGNWQALHRMLAELAGGDFVVTTPSDHVDVGSSNCLVMSTDDDRMIATAGLQDIVLVSTPDVVFAVHMSVLEDDPQIMARLMGRLDQDQLSKYR